MIRYLQGEVWLLNLNPTKGREVRGTRPGLIISVDLFNKGPTDLVIIIPITTKRKNTPFHIEIKPPEGGINQVSFVKCEDIRSVSKERLIKRYGKVSDSSLEKIKDRLKILLG